MGRLSSYAKNRILKLRFKKNKRIIHIVDILKNEDNIKVSRQAVSTFLKKYLETNSIYDKPRTGRKRKLTQEEIQLIGQVTRLNRDITARAIKEYLNLNVSTYTILRATKLFEWNKVNPNSNDSKKAAAIERQLNGSGESTGFEGTEDEVLVPGEISLVVRPASPSSAAVAENSQTINTTAEAAQIDEQQQNGKRKKTGRRAGANQSRIGRKYKKRKGAAGDGEENGGGGETVSELENAGFSGGGFTAEDEDDDDEEVEKIQLKPLVDQEMKKGGGDMEKRPYSSNERRSSKPRHTVNSIPDFEKVNLNLIPHNELVILKNLSCSPMSFATKILFKIFKIDELHGHNVSGKTLNKNLKAKLPLDPLRVGYIKYLVEAYYDEKESKQMLCGVTSNKQDLWKSCHTAINKSILISERKAEAAAAAGKPFVFCDPTLETFNQRMQAKEKGNKDGLNTSMSQDEGDHTTGDSSREDLTSSSDGDSDDSDVDTYVRRSGGSGRAVNGTSKPRTTASSKRASLPRLSKSNKRIVVHDSASDGERSGDSSDDEADNHEDGVNHDHEVELIQSRLGKKSAAVSSAAKKNTSSTTSPKSVVKAEVSSEASAAANIAAAMKKRLVVVAGPNNDPPVAEDKTNNASIRTRLRTRTKQESA